MQSDGTAGRIHVHVNPAFRGVRISRQDVPPGERMHANDGSNEAYPFVLVFSRPFQDVDAAEHTLATEFAPHQSEYGPGFFTVEPAEAIDRVRALPGGLDSQVREVPGMEEVRSLVESGQTLMAIKRYRELTGEGLKESKDAVDAMFPTARTSSGCAGVLAVAAAVGLAAAEALTRLS